MRSLKILVLICFFIAAGICQAQPIDADLSNWSVNLGGFTHHFRNDKIRNDVNEGIGVERSVGKQVGFSIGGYENSIYRWSNYAYMRYQPLQLGVVRVGLLGGVVTGYKVCKVCSMVMPAASVDVTRNVTLSLVGVPSLNKEIDGMISLQISLRFSK